ncbi:28078_t:CDS:2, partial [Racocetra persica]
KQEILIEHTDELNKVQKSINKLKFTNPMSAQEYLNQDKDISIEEILDYDIIEKISLNNISKEKISIQDEDDTSTIHDDDEFFSNSNNSIQDILDTFNKLLFFLKYPPNNLEISKLEIESV